MFMTHVSRDRTASGFAPATRWSDPTDNAPSLMLLATAMALQLTGTVEDTNALLAVEHVAMLLGIMLARQAEYTTTTVTSPRPSGFSPRPPGLSVLV
jgi:hypothetical protein